MIAVTIFVFYGKEVHRNKQSRVQRSPFSKHTSRGILVFPAVGQYTMICYHNSLFLTPSIFWAVHIVYCHVVV